MLYFASSTPLTTANLHCHCFLEEDRLGTCDGKRKQGQNDEPSLCTRIDILRKTILEGVGIRNRIRQRDEIMSARCCIYKQELEDSCKGPLVSD